MESVPPPPQEEHLSVWLLFSVTPGTSRYCFTGLGNVFRGSSTPIKEVSNILSLHPFPLENRCVWLVGCHCDPISNKKQLSLPWKREDMGWSAQLGPYPTSHLGETVGGKWTGVGMAINPQSLPPERDFLQRDSTS